MLTVHAVLACVAWCSANTVCKGCTRGDANEQNPDKCLWPDRGCGVCHIDLRGDGRNISLEFVQVQLNFGLYRVPPVIAASILTFLCDVQGRDKSVQLAKKQGSFIEMFLQGATAFAARVVAFLRDCRHDSSGTGCQP